MKKILLILFIIVSISAKFVDAKETEAKIMDNAKLSEQDLIFGLGQEGPKDYFTGDAWVNMLIADPKDSDLLLYNVTFSPKARNFWHKHSKGQILLVTYGEGYYQEKGKPAQLLKKGDMVKIPANTEHWHGATADKTFVHLGITPEAKTNQVEWLDPVSDEEYNKI